MHKVPLWVAIFVFVMQLYLAFGDIKGIVVRDTLWPSIIINGVFIVVALINRFYKD